LPGRGKKRKKNIAIAMAKPSRNDGGITATESLFFIFFLRPLSERLSLIYKKLGFYFLYLKDIF